MQQGKAEGGGTASAPRTTDAPTTAPTVMPAELAAALRMMIVPGTAEPATDSRTDGTPLALALGLADLAARLAALELPAGAGLSISVDIQPDAPRGLLGVDRGRAEVGIVDATAAVLTPGVGPQVRWMTGDTFHYNATAVTPAGLGVSVFTGLDHKGEEFAPAELGHGA